MIYNQVYYVETDGLANPLAIRPEITDTFIGWMDTSKGRTVELGKIDYTEAVKDEPPEVIEVTSESGEHYTLRKLTLSLYNQNVKSRVALSPTFASDEEVQKFYLETSFEMI